MHEDIGQELASSLENVDAALDKCSVKGSEAKLQIEEMGYQFRWLTQLLTVLYAASNFAEDSVKEHLFRQHSKIATTLVQYLSIRSLPVPTFKIPSFNLKSLLPVGDPGDPDLFVESLPLPDRIVAMYNLFEARVVTAYKEAISNTVKQSCQASLDTRRTLLNTLEKLLIEIENLQAKNSSGASIWHNRAAIAVNEGRDDLAMESLRRKQRFEKCDSSRFRDLIQRLNESITTVKGL